jgi:hypothetical protein
MTIDTQCIPLVINSYLNFKTYSIIFINYFHKVVRWKLNEMWESWKGLKCHGWVMGVWMGIAWGNMEDGCMGPKHSSWNFTWFGGRYVSRAQVVWALKHMLGCLSKLDIFRWVVGFEVQVLRLMFQGVRFQTSWN